MAQVEQKKTFRRWYDEHRETYNKRRRAKYASDPKLRAEAKARALEYRTSTKKTKAKTLYRPVLGIQVQVFTTGMLEPVLGVTRQAICKWEDLGWIPKSIFPDTMRLYTKGQVQLLKKFAAFLVKASGHGRIDRSKLAEMTEYIKEHWED